MSIAPVVVFTYNRYEEIMQVMDTLAKNMLAKETDVYIFSNAPREEVHDDVQVVTRIREDLKQFASSFKRYEIIEREVNNGPNDNMLDGINRVIHRYGKVIVLEDDIITAPSFLTFMNEALEEYIEDTDVFSICGYNPTRYETKLPGDTFSYDAFRSWGWAIWENRWDTVSMQDELATKLDLYKIHTEDLGFVGGIQYDILFETHEQGRYLDYKLKCRQLMDKKTVIYPKVSMCDHIGFGGKNLSQREFPDYENKNFSLDFVQESFNFSKRKLDINSDRDYFWIYRKGGVFAEVYKNVNNSASRLYANMYYGIIRLYRENLSLKDYLKQKGVEKVAIYGFGEAGKLLYRLLTDEDVKVVYILDKNPLLGEIGVPVYSNILECPEVDMLIATPIWDFAQIQETLYGEIGSKLVCMNDVICDVICMSKK